MKRLLNIALMMIALQANAQVGSRLKTNIDTAITNKTAGKSITATTVGTQMKAIVDTLLKNDSTKIAKADSGSSGPGKYITPTMLNAAVVSSVTGTGTAGRVHRYTGTNTMTSGSIRDDGTSVGVGGSPTGTFDVMASSPAGGVDAGVRNTSSSGYSRFLLRDQNGNVGLSLGYFNDSWSGSGAIAPGRAYLRNDNGDISLLSYTYEITFYRGGNTSSDLKARLSTSNNFVVGSSNPTDAGSGRIQAVDGHLAVNTSGYTLKLRAGSNPAVGTATLSSGTVTVNTTAVTANSKIFLTYKNCSNCGTLYKGTITAGTSFVIQSSNASDASQVDWWILETF